MQEDIDCESMLDIFILETSQYIELLEKLLDCADMNSFYSQCSEIFRIMHNIRGSSGLMNIGNITQVSHAVESLFYKATEIKPKGTDFNSLKDITFCAVGFIKAELSKISSGKEADDDPTALVNEIVQYL